MGSLPPTTSVLTSPVAAQRNAEKPADLNVHSVVLGDVSFKTWYPSYYPEELVGREIDRLYVCHWCFKYSRNITRYQAHRVRHSSLARGSLMSDDPFKEAVSM